MFREEVEETVFGIIWKCVQILHMDVDLLRFCKDAGSFELIKFGL